MLHSDVEPTYGENNPLVQPNKYLPLLYISFCIRLFNLAQFLCFLFAKKILKQSFSSSYLEVCQEQLSNTRTLSSQTHTYTLELTQAELRTIALPHVQLTFIAMGYVKREFLIRVISLELYRSSRTWPQFCNKKRWRKIQSC